MGRRRGQRWSIPMGNSSRCPSSPSMSPKNSKARSNTSFIKSVASFAGPAPHPWWWLLVTIVLLGFLIFLSDWKRSPRIVTAIASVSLVLFYAHYPARDLLVDHRFQQSAVALWFFAVGVLTIVALKARLRSGDWEKTAFLVLWALFVFAFFYY